MDARKRMKAARALAGLSIRELAERMPAANKMGERTLRKLESGESELRPMELREIARACGVPYAFFTIDSFDILDELEAERPQLERIEDKLDQLLDYFTPRATGQALEAAAQGAVAALAAALPPRDDRKTA